MRWALPAPSPTASLLWIMARSSRSRRPETSSTTPRASVQRNSWRKSSIEEGKVDPNERLGELERLGEAYYDAMYDSRYPTGEYADAKDAFRDAIALARELGDTKTVERLEARLAHIKAVFRS